MNKNQKYILISGIVLIIAVIIYWYTQGAEVFTKTKVLVDKTTELDRMLGIENKKYVDKFIFGLFPSGTSAIVELLSVATMLGIVIVLSIVIIYLYRNKQKEML